MQQPASQPPIDFPTNTAGQKRPKRRCVMPRSLTSAIARVPLPLKQVRDELVYFFCHTAIGCLAYCWIDADAARSSASSSMGSLTRPTLAPLPECKTA